MEKKYIYQGEILVNETCSPGIMKMEILAAQAAAEARPGQFINVYPNGDRMILPRPISICDADPAEGTLTLLYDVVGRGTEEMSQMGRGDIIKISSPLGNGFTLPEEGRPVLMISGGVGTAPMLFLARRISELKNRMTAVTGFRKDPLLTEELREADCRVLVTTELPGEDSFVGNVIDCMEINGISPDPDWVCYACGPGPMLKAVSSFLEKLDPDINLQVSLEERMGCGYGVCVGCARDIRTGTDQDGNDIIVRKKVCKDGPVFDAKEVVW